jgi:5-methylcytosine-specific restriction endonuclease McrA
MTAYSQAEYKTNRRLVLEAAHHQCQWPGCGRPANTADHIVPLAYGGSNDLANLRALCWHHNSVGGAAITNTIKRARRIGRRSRRW